MLAIVPPWRIPSRFLHRISRCGVDELGSLCWGSPYGVFFLNVELEGDDSWLSSCDSELDDCQIEPCKDSLNQEDVAKTDREESGKRYRN